MALRGRESEGEALTLSPLPVCSVVWWLALTCLCAVLCCGVGCAGLAVEAPGRVPALRRRDATLRVSTLNSPRITMPAVKPAIPRNEECEVSYWPQTLFIPPLSTLGEYGDEMTLLCYVCYGV